MSLYLDLKSAITQSGMKLYEINDELNRRNGTNLTFQNFSNRLRKSIFRYEEVVQILDIAGYEIQWVKK